MCCSIFFHHLIISNYVMRNKIEIYGSHEVCYVLVLNKHVTCRTEIKLIRCRIQCNSIMG